MNERALGLEERSGTSSTYTNDRQANDAHANARDITGILLLLLRVVRKNNNSDNDEEKNEE